MEANKILSADILDLVFEDRNKDYGAYDLRKTYNKRIRMALIITASIALLALAGSFLANKFKPKQKQVQVKDLVLENITQQEEKKPEPPPPPPPKQEPPKVEMTKFTPPKVVKDEEVKKDEIPPETKQLEDTKIDVISQEGIKDQGLAPAIVDQGKQVIEEKKEDDENKVFEKVEIEASFPGGESGWRRFLERNLDPNVPVDNGAPEGQYTVWVQFIVDKEGNISDVKALTNHGYGMEDEAVKTIKRGPKWVPAQQNGRQVKAYRKQPITFVVQSE
ncbi:MAG TPA: energy transducer TonB [Chitinophagaceae bacterium]|jgi:protein TonB|nr:energy transducer TonB [Chitinophagaceae bacterium]